jgi:hypothetical protein
MYPLYQCHKFVHALKIRNVAQVIDGFNSHYELIPEDEQYDPVVITEEWKTKHDPQPGGYYVVYDDGYTSFSPAQAFEDGYTLIAS